MDAFLAELGPKIRFRQKSSLQEIFIDSARQLVLALKGPEGELLRHLLGAAQSDPKLQKAFQENWVAPRRAQAMAVIEQAQADGTLSAKIDPDALLDVIYGAIYFRLMIPYKELSTAYVEKMVRQVFEGLAGDHRT